MSIKWNPSKTVGKSQHAYYRLSKRFCPDPMVEDDRWFVEYQARRGPYDPNGKFAVVVQAFGFETQEAAVAGAEQNAEWSLKDFR
jgi:hypothetical protein